MNRRIFIKTSAIAVGTLVGVKITTPETIEWSAGADHSFRSVSKALNAIPDDGNNYIITYHPTKKQLAQNRDIYKGGWFFQHPDRWIRVRSRFAGGDA